MTNTLINYIQLDADNKTLTGNIASLPSTSRSPAKPSQVTMKRHRLPHLRHDTRGRRIEIGGIWEKESQLGKPYLT